MKAAGVIVLFEQENLDTDEVDSNLMISVMESFAQAENEIRSENIRMGLAMKAANRTSGLYKRKLYGYAKNENGELVIDNEHAKVCGTFSDGILMAPACLAFLRSCRKLAFRLLPVRNNGISER